MITLRAIEKEDLRMLKDWRNQDEVRSVTREYRNVSMDDQYRWYDSYVRARNYADWAQELSIIQADRIPIGVGGFVRIEWRNRKAELSFYLCRGRHREKAVILPAIKTILYRGFHELNFNKVVWPVFGHDTCLPIYRVALNLEATLRSEYFWHGKFYDRYYLSLLKREFDRMN